MQREANMAGQPAKRAMSAVVTARDWLVTTSVTKVTPRDYTCGARHVATCLARRPSPARLLQFLPCRRGEYGDTNPQHRTGCGSGNDQLSA